MESSVRKPSAFSTVIKQACFIVEYWLSSLKVFTVILFIIVGIFVNVGLNTEHRFIGVSNWQIPGAPFVGGFGGFARVFVTASFACTSLLVVYNRIYLLSI
jgi:amino acid permease